jgi:hypothetical protein
MSAATDIIAVFSAIKMLDIYGEKYGKGGGGGEIFGEIWRKFPKYASFLVSKAEM